VKIKIIGVAVVALMLAGCTAASVEPIELADACDAWVEAAATVPDGEPEATSAYLNSMAEYLGNVADMAEATAPGLKETDAIAGGTFERLGESAREAQSVAEVVASGEREPTASDAETLETVQATSSAANDLCD
jgi:hypothetical protein